MLGRRKLAAIMFTDIEGYTARAQENESVALSILGELRSMLRPIFAKHHGMEVKSMGDAFLVEFESALDATECALEIQSTLVGRDQRRFESVPLRVGIHVGDVVQEEGDVFGDAVNIASRIEPLAEGGGVCITEQVYAQVRNKVRASFVSLGPQALKNVAYPVEVFRVSSAGGGEFQGQAEAEPDSARMAVLPFTNLSPNQSDEYIADAITEELITALSTVKSLRVIARTSVMHFKGSGKSIAEIGRALKVPSALEGSVLKLGNKMRITVQLVDTTTEEHLWANRYDRDIDNIFKIQDDIAKRVSKALKMKLSGSEAKSRTTKDLGAYTHYLRGRRFLYGRTADETSESIKQFELAVARDPKYAPAYAGLADAYYLRGYYGFAPVMESYLKAHEYATRALGIDESLAEAHATIGVLRDHEDFDFAGAEAEFKRAIHFNPSYAQAHHWYCVTLLSVGRLQDALAEINRAQLADPLSPMISVVKGNVLSFSGRNEEALSEWMAVEEADPSFNVLYFQRAIFFIDREQEMKAAADIATRRKLVPDDVAGRFLRGFAAARFGRKAEALGIIEEFKEPNELQAGGAEFIAHISAALGDNDGFFEWANRAIDGKDFELVAVRYLKTYEKVRADKRYPVLLARLKLSP